MREGGTDHSPSLLFRFANHAATLKRRCIQCIHMRSCSKHSLDLCIVCCCLHILWQPHLCPDVRNSTRTVEQASLVTGPIHKVIGHHWPYERMELPDLPYCSRHLQEVLKRYAGIAQKPLDGLIGRSQHGEAHPSISRLLGNPNHRCRLQQQCVLGQKHGWRNAVFVLSSVASQPTFSTESTSKVKTVSSVNY